MIDPRQYKKMMGKGKVVLEKEGETIIATYYYSDKEGVQTPETERTTLAEVQRVLQETIKDRDALQDLEAAIIALG